MFKNLLLHCFYFLNEPSVKEGIKNFTGLAFCLFGIVELRRICFKPSCQNKNFIRTFASISILLAPITTRQGIFFISVIASFIPMPEFNFFGENTFFAVNPWHPKHILSIISLFFALPVLWRKIFYQENEISNGLVFALTFNTLTSRPALHLGNQLTYFLLNT